MPLFTDSHSHCIIFGVHNPQCRSRSANLESKCTSSICAVWFVLVKMWLRLVVWILEVPHYPLEIIIFPPQLFHGFLIFPRIPNLEANDQLTISRVCLVRLLKHVSASLPENAANFLLHFWGSPDTDDISQTRTRTCWYWWYTCGTYPDIPCTLLYIPMKVYFWLKASQKSFVEHVEELHPTYCYFLWGKCYNQTLKRATQFHWKSENIGLFYQFWGFIYHTVDTFFTICGWSLTVAARTDVSMQEIERLLKVNHDLQRQVANKVF